MLLFNNLFAQTPIRKVLYKLAPSEIILTGEHIIQYTTDGYKFALLTTDTLTNKKNTLIFNDKRISMNNNCFSLGYLAYINVNEEDGYIIIDKKDNGYYVNNGGKIEGPYEYAWSDANWDTWNPYDESSFPRTGFYGSKRYHYVLADRVYDNMDGQVRKSQGIFYLDNMNGDADDYVVVANGVMKRYSMPGYIYVNGDNYAYLGYIAGSANRSLFINGIHEIDADVSNIVLNNNGDYAYSYYSSNNMSDEYLVKNGNIINKSTNIESLCLTDAGDIAYISNHKHLNLPFEKDTTDFEEESFLKYHDKDNYAFCFKKDGKWYVRIKGQADKGPYSICEGLLVNKFGDYIYAFKDKSYHVKTNRSDYGPFRYAEIIDLSDEGEYIYDYYKDENTIYRSVNGTTKSFYDIIYKGINLDIDNHNFYSHYKYDYVVIDGKRVGNSAAIECRYDKKKNAFVWYSIEGRELVVYEYPLN